MDTIESWYSETGGLSYDEPKANTWHTLVWIYYERGSCHPLTAAAHKWSYQSEETLSLASSGVWIGLHLPTKPHISQSRHDKALDSLTIRLSTKTLSGTGHQEHRALSFWCLLGVLRRIGQHGERYDPSTVKHRKRSTSKNNLYLFFYYCHPLLSSFSHTGSNFFS